MNSRGRHTVAPKRHSRSQRSRPALELVGSAIPAPAHRLRADGEHRHIAVVRSTDATPATSAESTLPDLLREQVRRQPDHVAVVFGGEQLTYRELGRASSRVAAHLRDLGVGADDCVGLFVERSLELMVGIWGSCAPAVRTSRSRRSTPRTGCGT